MFIDYYAILGIDSNASNEEIKSAFKRQALKWHPDRNGGVDTTDMMQKINEAYLILKDQEAKSLYDTEYYRFKEFQNKRAQPANDRKKAQSNHEKAQEESTYSNTEKTEGKEGQNESSGSYEILDETLNRWMQNARQQAVNLAQETVHDLREMSKVSGKAIGNELIGGVLKFLFFGLIMTIIVKACNS